MSLYGGAVALQNRFIGEIMKSFFKSSLAAAIVAAALAVAAVANQGGGAGSISGTVLDSTGAVVANATVEIHNPITGFERQPNHRRPGSLPAPAVESGPGHPQLGDHLIDRQ